MSINDQSTECSKPSTDINTIIRNTRIKHVHLYTSSFKHSVKGYRKYWSFLNTIMIMSEWALRTGQNWRYLIFIDIVVSVTVSVVSSMEKVYCWFCKWHSYSLINDTWKFQGNQTKCKLIYRKITSIYGFEKRLSNLVFGCIVRNRHPSLKECCCPAPQSPIVSQDNDLWKIQRYTIV